jgi:hypothetical protein
MAAGLGFKDFVTGEVLTAADVDGYLMQGVWVFASAAARDAAVTSPQEGNFAYLKDTNVTTYYTGSAWANLDTTGMTNPMTTTGDIIYSSPGSTPVRLGIGSTGNVLTVASGVPSWAAPAGGGGYTLINTGGTTFSGTSITISTIPATYKFLYLVVVDAYVGTADKLEMRLNGDTATNYRYTAIQNSNTTLTGYQGDPQDNLKVTDHIGTSTDDNKKTFGVATITNYTATTGAAVFSDFWAYNAGSSLTIATTMTGVYNNSAAITSLTLRTGNGNSFSGGTAYLYGVN